MNTPSSYSYMSYMLGHNDNPNHSEHIIQTAELCRRICLETINEVVPQMVEEVSLKVIKEFLNSNLNGSLKYDVRSLASVSIADFNKIFKSEQFSRFISDAVADEIRKRIDEIKIEIK